MPSQSVIRLVEIHAHCYVSSLVTYVYHPYSNPCVSPNACKSSMALLYPSKVVIDLGFYLFWLMLRVLSPPLTIPNHQFLPPGSPGRNTPPTNIPVTCTDNIFPFSHDGNWQETDCVWIEQLQPANRYDELAIAMARADNMDTALATSMQSALTQISQDTRLISSN